MGRATEAIFEFYRKVRESPALSVGPELEKLKAAAQRGDDAAGYAYKSPVANLTWMQRGMLYRDRLQSAQLPMEIPFACKIVGCKVEMVAGENPNGDGVTWVEAPLSAVDIVMQLNRAEVFTARMDKLLTQEQDAMVCSLGAFDNAVRSFELELNHDDNILTVQFKWAVPLDLVAQFAWSSMQISVNWFVDPKIRYGEQRFAKPTS